MARESEGVRAASTKLAGQPWQQTLRVIERLPELLLPRRHAVSLADINPRYLNKILLRTYERAPKDFEGLLSEIQGPRGTKKRRNKNCELRIANCEFKEATRFANLRALLKFAIRNSKFLIRNSKFDIF